MQEERESVRNLISSSIENAETVEELKAAEIEIIEMIRENPAIKTSSGYTSEDIESMINKKMEELAFDFVLSEFNVGEVVILNDKFGNKATVEKVNLEDGSLLLVPLNDKAKPFTVTDSNLKSKIKYKYSKALEEVAKKGTEQGSEIEPNTEEAILGEQTTLDFNEVVSRKDQLKNMINESDAVDVDAAWLDDINNCS